MNTEDNSKKSDSPQTTEALKHSSSYTKILDQYVVSTKRNMTIKIYFKAIFFFITMGILVAIVYFFYTSLQYLFDNFNKFESLNDITFEAILSMITIILPAISSLIVAFVKIPEIIAQYLFNIEEDNSMNSVIKSIQDYDKEMFAMEHRVENILLQTKEQSSQTQDDEILESPREKTFLKKGIKEQN